MTAPEAAYWLGRLHNFDSGFYDAPAAFHWFLMAAEGGVAPAMF